MNTELIQRVEALLAEIKETHRYSMSRVYAAYNEAFDKNETPQSCSSCLIRKKNELTEWLEAEKLKAEKENIEIPPIEVKTKKGGKK